MNKCGFKTWKEYTIGTTLPFSSWKWDGKCQLFDANIFHHILKSEKWEIEVATKPCLRHDITDIRFCCISKQCFLTTYSYVIFWKNIDCVFDVAKLCWKLLRDNKYLLNKLCTATTTTTILGLSGQPGWAGTRRYISQSSGFSGAKWR